jgi:hypothetical protein
MFRLQFEHALVIKTVTADNRALRTKLIIFRIYHELHSDRSSCEIHECARVLDAPRAPK